MLTEHICLRCKHYIFDFSFEHKCAFYPKGIPDKVFNDNIYDKICKEGRKGFELERIEE